MTNAPLSSVSSAIAQDLFCPSCGYNLRGLTGERCPECGESIEGVRSNVCQIPWVHRKELGWWRAYWKTVYFVMFKQRQFANEMARPVSYADSQRFRWLTVAWASLPVLLSGVAFWVPRAPQPVDTVFFNVLWSIGFGPIWHICLILFLSAATAMPSYFFHPGDVPIEQQNRAVALSYYFCAPLSFSLVPSALVCCALQITGSPSDSIGIWLERKSIDILSGFLAIGFGLGILTAWWVCLIRFARHALAQNERQRGLAAVLIPPLWVVLFGAIVIALPMVVLFLVMFFAVLVGSLL